jgi:hypothetical protein
VENRLYLAIAADLNLFVVIPRIDKMVDILEWDILAEKTLKCKLEVFHMEKFQPVF